MSERSRAQVLRRNEQLKATSSIVSNLSAALIAAAFARWFAVAFDPFVILWLAVGIVGAAVGVSILMMLETEEL